MHEKAQSYEPEPHLVMATVYLKSRSGRSLLQADQGALTDPTSYMPDPVTVEKAVIELELLGFTIEGRGVTISISGPIELFEEVCNTRITVEKVPDNLALEIGSQIKHIYRSSEQVMQISELEEIIEGIALAAPGVAFQ